MAEIDNLAIVISAQASDASTALTNLTSKLKSLSSSLNSLSSGNLTNLAHGVSQLGAAMKSMQGVKKTDFNRLAKGIESVNNINASGLQTVAAAISPFADSVSKLNNIQFDTKNVSNLINAITRLSSVDTSGLANADLSRIGTQIKNLTASLQGAQKVQQSTISITNAIANLSRYGGSIPTVTSSLAQLGTSLRTFISTMSSSAIVSSETIQFTSAIGSLAAAGSKTNATASSLGLLATELKKFFTTMSTAPQVNSNIIQMTQALGQLASAGGSAASAMSTVNNASSGTDISSVLSSVQSVFSASGIGGTVSSLSGLLAFIPEVGPVLSGVAATVGSGLTVAETGLNKVSTVVSNVWNKFESTFGTGGQGLLTQFAAKVGMLYAQFWVLIRVVQKLGDAIETSMDYIETLNYYESAFEQVADNADLSNWKELGYESAEEYANSFEERAKEVTAQMTGWQITDTGELERTESMSLGLDPSEVMNYQAVYSQMATSMGLASEQAETLQNVLIKLGGDLASIKNTDFASAWEDLESTLTGTVQPMKEYGVSLLETSLQETLTKLGIDATVDSLSQQDKVLLRVITTLQSSEYAWGDLADTVNQPANQLRLLSSNWTMLCQIIGNLFMPLVQKILPYINAIVVVLQRVFTWIGKLFGLDLSNVTSSTGSSGLSDLADDAEDTSSGLDDSADSAKKLKRQLQGFDELNNLTTSTTSTGSGSGGSGGGLSTSDLLGEAFNEEANKYLEKWQEAFDDMENSIDEIADHIVEAFEPTKEAIENLFGDGLQKAWDFTKATFKDAGEQLIKPLFEYMFSNEDTGIPHFIDSFNDLLNNVDWDRLQSSLSGFYSAVAKIGTFAIDVGNDIFDYLLKPFSEFMLSKGIPDLLDIFTRFTDGIDWRTLRESLQQVWSSLESIGEGTWGTLFEIIDDFFVPLGEWTLNEAIPALADTFAYIVDNIDWNWLKRIIKAVGEQFKTLLEKITDLSKNEKFIDFVKTMIEKFEKFIKLGLAVVFTNIASAILAAKIAIAAIKFAVSDFGSPLKAFITLVKSGLSSIKEHIIALKANIALLKAGATAAFEAIKTAVVNMKDSVGDAFNMVKERFASLKSKLSEPITFSLENLKEKVSTAWSKVTEWWNGGKKTALSKITTTVEDIKSKVQDAWSNARTWWGTKSPLAQISVSVPDILGKIKQAWNNVLTWAQSNFKLNFHVEFTTATTRIQKAVVKAFSLSGWPTLRFYEAGGYPDIGDLFVANENGVPELVGTMGGKPAVASGKEITGISDAIYATAQSEMALLRQQNQLLQSILNKEFGISQSDIYNAVRRENRTYYNQTGRNALVY